MSYLLMLLISAALAGIAIALHNPVFRKQATTDFPEYRTGADYLRPWLFYFVLGSIGAFLLHLFVKFGPVVADLYVLPAFIGAFVMIGLLVFFLYYLKPGTPSLVKG